MQATLWLSVMMSLSWRRLEAATAADELHPDGAGAGEAPTLEPLLILADEEAAATTPNPDHVDTAPAVFDEPAPEAEPWPEAAAMSVLEEMPVAEEMPVIVEMHLGEAMPGAEAMPCAEATPVAEPTPLDETMPAAQGMHA